MYYGIKRVIAVCALAAVSACAMVTGAVLTPPRTFAAETVTADMVAEAKSVNSLAESERDMELFGGVSVEMYGDAPEYEWERLRVKEKASAAEAYKVYNFSDVLIETEDIRFKEALFHNLDPKDTTIKSIISADGEKVRYVYKDMKLGYKMGEIYLTEEKQGLNNSYMEDTYSYDGTDKLFFSNDELAEVIDKSGIGKPEDIRYIDRVFRFGGGGELSDTIIYVQTASGEYIVSSARYIDGELKYYLVLDSEEFIGVMQDKPGTATETIYNSFSVENEPSFSDVKNDSAVSLLARMGIVSGYEDGSFGPDRSITRAEAARMLALVTSEENSFEEYLDTDYYCNLDIFDDIPVGHWAREYIIYGVSEGYINGVEKTGRKEIDNRKAGYDVEWDGSLVPRVVEGEVDTYKFCPDDAVTEQQLAKMLVSAVDEFGDTMADGEGGYPDGYVSVAKRLGICEDASDKPATRLTAAHMIKNALDARVTKRFSAEEKNTYNDNGELVMRETFYEKEVFYNAYSLNKRRAKMRGTVTADHDTDSRIREKEVTFSLSEDADVSWNNYKAGKTLTLMARYYDIHDFVSRECNMYIEKIGDTLVAVMAE